MGKLLRRIRGVLAMGFIWAVVWSAVGAMPRWVFGVRADAPFGLIFGIIGFIAGVTFALLLVLTEGRRGFDQMSLPRFAGLGATGGLVVSAIWANVASLGWGDLLTLAPALVLACAACASGSLALARRAVRRTSTGF